MAKQQAQLAESQPEKVKMRELDTPYGENLARVIEVDAEQAKNMESLAKQTGVKTWERASKTAELTEPASTEDSEPTTV